MYDSPVVRRAKRTGYLQNTPDPKMRRSISLNQADFLEQRLRERAEEEEAIKAVEDSVLDSCTQYLEENPDEIVVQDQPAENPDSKTTATTYGTLPKVMRKNISRSLVPKMRRMFEKARSCDPPELPTIRIRIQTDSHPHPGHRSLSPPALEDHGGSGISVKSDGTESVSSFVAVSTEDGLEESSSLVDDEDSSVVSQSRDKSNCSGLSNSDNSGTANINNNPAKKGFVNKCVKKVKNIMGSSGKLSSQKQDA